MFQGPKEVTYWARRAASATPEVHLIILSIIWARKGSITPVYLPNREQNKQLGIYEGANYCSYMGRVMLWNS